MPPVVRTVTRGSLRTGQRPPLSVVPCIGLSQIHTKPGEAESAEVSLARTTHSYDTLPISGKTCCIRLGVAVMLRGWRKAAMSPDPTLWIGWERQSVLCSSLGAGGIVSFCFALSTCSTFNHAIPLQGRAAQLCPPLLPHRLGHALTRSTTGLPDAGAHTGCLGAQHTLSMRGRPGVRAPTATFQLYWVYSTACTLLRSPACKRGSSALAPPQEPRQRYTARAVGTGGRSDPCAVHPFALRSPSCERKKTCAVSTSLALNPPASRSASRSATFQIPLTSSRIMAKRMSRARGSSLGSTPSPDMDAPPRSHTTCATAPVLHVCICGAPPHTQIPHYVHDRSTFAFAAALTIDLLNVLFEQRATRLDLVLLPAFIKVRGWYSCPPSSR